MIIRKVYTTEKPKRKERKDVGKEREKLLQTLFIEVNLLIYAWPRKEK